MEKSKKGIQWLERMILPATNKINGNVWVQTIRDTMLQLLPFIFIGSIFNIFGIITEIFPNFPIDGYTLAGWSFGKISLFVAFLIPFNYCEKKRLRKQRIVAGATALSLFLIMLTPQMTLNEVVGFGHSTLGAGGMIAAMIAGVITALIIKLSSKFSFFKKDSVIPDFIREWFDLMVPIFLVIFLGWLVVLKLNIDLFHIIETLFSPLALGMQILPIYILFEIIRTGLYALGISNWALTGIWTPIVLAAIASNTEMVAAGTATAANLNLITNEASNIYLLLGGMGATLSLNLMMLKAKSKRLQIIGKAGIVPSIMNINEPIVFGCISWNPIMMIPFIMTAIVLPVVTWIFTKAIPLAPIPTHLFNLWFCPIGISSYLTTGSVRACLLTLINFIVSGIIYYPFFSIYDKQEAAKEEMEAANK